MAAALGQSKPLASASLSGLELPVHMRQNVEAGKTPIGTKVEATLDLATFVNGVVLPAGAILSGEVIESVAKSGAAPSRLALRMDAAKWKNGSVPETITLSAKVYLTAWCYPSLPTEEQDSSVLPDATHNSSQHRGGSAPYPDPNTSASPPYSHGNTGRVPNLEPAPAPEPAHGLQHRVPMKNVESERNVGGTITLTSKRSNIKLNRSITYVLATEDLLPPK